MANDSSRVTLHMVSSLDGFIAKKDNDVSWLRSADSYEKGITLTEEEIAAFIKTIDCYVMGSRTYEHTLTLGWPYGDKPVIVLTKRGLKTDRTSVKFYSGSLDELVNQQLKPKFRNIWLVGGAELTKELLRLKLVDDIIISFMPIMLGDGTLFFDYIKQEQKLHLRDVTAYSDGMVELWYEVIKT